MSLSPGARLGPYEILGPLGAGGMGEVHRARDPRLGREVAIKVLPEGLTRDSERLRRFEHEARAAGALNHPNVLAVFDTGSHDGSPYVVSELLDGQTLRERMGGAALSVRKAVEIAAQIARGLAAAHEKGIVHRDLKPENVFVTKDGHVKILDFGLAKLTHAATDAGDSRLPTRTRETDPGTVMGTAGYMSPEQVRGDTVDHRSDIFSFGAILYETIAGRRAFKGATTAETMAAILREDPPELSETNKAVPPALERIVRHCLEKSPEERFASARDLAFDLQAVSDTSAPTPKAAGKRHRFSTRIAAAGAVWTLAVAGGAFWLGRTTHDGAGSPSYRALTFRRGALNAARFSPDGSYLLYSAAWDGGPSQVYSTRLDVPGEQPLLPGMLAGVAPGEMIVLRPDGMLVRAPLSGGGPREVAEGVKAAALSRDGSRTAVVRRSGPKTRLESPPGTMLYETAGEIRELRFSPDGTRVAFIEWPNAGWSFGQVKVVDFARNERTLTPVRLTRGLVWSPDASELWFSVDAEKGYALHAVSLSGRERLLLHTAHRPALHDAIADGRVLLDLSYELKEVAGQEPGQARERSLSWYDAEAYDISTDGKTFTFCVGLPALTYLGGMDGTPPVRLGDGCPAGLSPDGLWVAVTDAGGNTLSLLPTGPGEVRRPAMGTIRQYFDIRFMPDSRRILFSGNEKGRPRRLFLQDVESGPPRAVTPEGISTEYSYPSPDGRWVAAGGDWRQSPYALYPLDRGDPRPIPGLEKGEQPLRFDADGSHLFVRVSEKSDVPAARVIRLDLKSGRKEPWKEIAPTDRAGVSEINFLYLTPDGRGHLYHFTRRLSMLHLVEGLR